jgi:hypothetical protein
MGCGCNLADVINHNLFHLFYRWLAREKLAHALNQRLREVTAELVEILVADPFALLEPFDRGLAHHHRNRSPDCRGKNPGGPRSEL